MGGDESVEVVWEEVLARDSDEAFEGRGGALEGGLRSCVLDFGRNKRDMKPCFGDCGSAIVNEMMC